MHSSYRRLVNSNPKTRLSVGHFLEQGRRNGGFFETPLIKLTETVDNLGVKTEEEREEFLKYATPRIPLNELVVSYAIVIWISYPMTSRRIISG
jgi:hypothetical protein